MTQPESGSKLSDDKNKEFVNMMSGSYVQIYVYIMSAVGNANDSDDIMQNTAVLMWERFAEFKPGTDFTRWGMTIAFYKIKEFRYQQKRHQYSDEVINKLQKNAFEELKDTNVYIEHLQHCLSKLPKDDLELIKARYESGHSVKDISAKVNRTVQAVYIRLSKIHGILSRCINLMITREVK